MHSPWPIGWNMLYPVLKAG